MAVPIVRAIVIEQSELVTNRNHPRFVRAALERVARFHVRERMQEWKFSKNPLTAPGGPYGYKARGKKYLERKRRKFGTDAPWYRTGRAKTYLGRNYRITKTQYSATLYLKNYFPMKDEMRAELESMTPSETRDMVVQAHEFYAEEITKPENQRKRKRRI